MRLLEGLDDIGLTLKHTDEIVALGEAHGGRAALAAERAGRTALRSYVLMPGVTIDGEAST